MGDGEGGMCLCPTKLLVTIRPLFQGLCATSPASALMAICMYIIMESLNAFSSETVWPISSIHARQDPSPTTILAASSHKAARRTNNTRTAALERSEVNTTEDLHVSYNRNIPEDYLPLLMGCILVLNHEIWAKCHLFHIKPTVKEN